ncbi:MAG: TolC family protein [Gemmatimonadota bacterium]|nr:TolC family protein [Gemmatimonadota bacterium]
MRDRTRRIALANIARLQAHFGKRAFTILLFVAALPAAAAGQQRVPQSLSLGQALEIALDNNPAMQATRNDVRVANWNLTAAYGQWMPTASLSSGFGWQGVGEQRFGSITAEQLGFGDQPSFLTSSYNASVGFSLNGRMLMAPGQARRNRDATRAQVRSQEATIRLGVTRAYLEVLRQTEGLRLFEQELATAQLNLRLAQGQQVAGSGNAIDVQQAEVAVGRAEVAVLRSQTGVQTSRIRLLQQMGADPAAEPELVTAFTVTEPDWTADGLYQMALGRNPGLEAARASEKASSYGVHMARSSYFPSVSVSAGLSGFTRQASNTRSQEAQAIAGGVAAVQQCRSLNQLLSALPNPPAPQDCSRLVTSQATIDAIRAGNRAFPFDFTNSPPSAGLSVSIPIFQGLSRQQQLEGARAQLFDARFRVREQELALRADIETRVAEVRTAYETSLIEERNQALADEQLRLAQERYRLGLLNFIALSEAVTVKARADRDRLYAIYTYHDAVANLESVVGIPLRNP